MKFVISPENKARQAKGERDGGGAGSGSSGNGGGGASNTTRAGNYCIGFKLISTAWKAPVMSSSCKIRAASTV